MKMYYFNPNKYGEQWFVMSDSEENAIKALNDYFANHKDKYMNDNHWTDGHLTSKSEFAKDGIFRHKGYTIDVFEANQVLNSEIA